MAYHVVLRPFNAAGCDLARGDVVSDEGWATRRAKVLTETRYIRPATAEEVAPAAESAAVAPPTAELVVEAASAAEPASSGRNLSRKRG